MKKSIFILTLALCTGTLKAEPLEEIWRQLSPEERAAYLNSSEQQKIQIQRDMVMAQTEVSRSYAPDAVTSDAAGYQSDQHRGKTLKEAIAEQNRRHARQQPLEDPIDGEEEILAWLKSKGKGNPTPTDVEKVRLYMAINGLRHASQIDGE